MNTKYKMVMVTWHDPSFVRGPLTEREEKDRSPLVVHDTGFLIHETDDAIHIAAAVNPEDGDLQNATVIQKVLVSEMWEVRPTKLLHPPPN